MERECRKQAGGFVLLSKSKGPLASENEPKGILARHWRQLKPLFSVILLLPLYSNAEILITMTETRDGISLIARGQADVRSLGFGADGLVANSDFAFHSGSGMVRVGITSALCGAKRPYQIVESAQAMTFRLSQSIANEITEALSRRGVPSSTSAVPAKS